MGELYGREVIRMAKAAGIDYEDDSAMVASERDVIRMAKAAGIDYEDDSAMVASELCNLAIMAGLSSVDEVVATLEKLDKLLARKPPGKIKTMEYKNHPIMGLIKKPKP